MIADAVYGGPVWAVLVAALLLGLLFAWSAQALVRRALSRQALKGYSDLVDFSATSIAVLYGALLAFLTVVSWEAFNKAEDDAGIEAGLLVDLQHDAHGLTHALTSDIDRLIRRYLDRVVEEEWPAQADGRVPHEGSEALAELHRRVAGLTPRYPGGAVIMADMLRVLGRIDAIRATRFEAQGRHIPGLVWASIVAVGLLLIGSAAMIPAPKPLVQAAVLGSFVVALVLVVVLIIELDNPYRGTLSVSAEPFRRAMAEFGPAAPASGKD